MLALEASFDGFRKPALRLLWDFGFACQLQRRRGDFDFFTVLLTVVWAINLQKSTQQTGVCLKMVELPAISCSVFSIQPGNPLLHSAVALMENMYPLLPLQRAEDSSGREPPTCFSAILCVSQGGQN